VFGSLTLSRLVPTKNDSIRERKTSAGWKKVRRYTGLNIESLTSIKLGDGELLYAETWLPDAENWFERLKNEVPWSPETVKMYGKPLVLKHETCNYGEDYDYNINAKPAIEWSGPVLELKKMLEEATGRVFTQCACNLYPDGETGIGLHHDKRHPLLVASISFGAVRTMGFAPKGGNSTSRCQWFR
jgi:alkylated DNA repair dioxygenase AlkB